MEKTIINKNDISILKKNNTDFNITIDLKNTEFNLINIININIIKLIYDLNVDFFDTIHIEKINESEANIFLLFKDLLKDIGYAHYYYYFHIKQDFSAMQFIITPLSEHNIAQHNIAQHNIAQHNIAQHNIAQHIESIEITKCILSYTILNEHNIQLNIDIKLQSPSESPIIEKIICNIIYKIINRVKQFVANIK
jgi:hypothetical protein